MQQDALAGAGSHTEVYGSFLSELPSAVRTSRIPVPREWWPRTSKTLKLKKAVAGDFLSYPALPSLPTWSHTDPGPSCLSQECASASLAAFWRACTCLVPSYAKGTILEL